MNTYKTHSLCVIALLVAPLAFMASFIFWVDPYQLFGMQPFAKPYFFQTSEDSERQRLQAFGLIYSNIATNKNNGIVIGSSRTIGMSSAMIARELNLDNVSNLSLIGGRGAENKVLAKRALETGLVKAVIWEVDYWFSDPREALGRIPSYLKTSTRIDDLQYFFTPYVLSDAIDLTLGRNLVSWSTGLDSLSSPMRHYTKNTFQQASSKIVEKMKPILRATKYEAGGWEGKSPRLDEDMIEVMRSYPAVEFYILFPVVPNILYASADPALFPAWVAGRRYMVEQSRDMPNVKIFAFDNDSNIAGNLANFFDENHSGRGGG